MRRVEFCQNPACMSASLDECNPHEHAHCERRRIRRPCQGPAGEKHVRRRTGPRGSEAVCRSLRAHEGGPAGRATRGVRGRDSSTPATTSRPLKKNRKPPPTMNGEEAVAELLDTLNDLGLEYLVVGSFSSNRYGAPRATKDADFVLRIAAAERRRQHPTDPPAPPRARPPPKLSHGFSFSFARRFLALASCQPMQVKQRDTPAQPSATSAGSGSPPPLSTKILTLRSGAKATSAVPPGRSSPARRFPAASHSSRNHWRRYAIIHQSENASAIGTISLAVPDVVYKISNPK